MFAISAGTKRQNFRGLTQLQQPNRKSRAGWFMCVCVLVFRLSRWVGQCVVLAERRGRRGHDPPLPLPTPAPVWKKWWVFFFFFRSEFRKFSSSATNQRRREDAEEVEGQGSLSNGGESAWWRWEFMRRAAVRKETPAEVMAAGHSSLSQLADLQAQLFSVANHLSSDSWWISSIFLSKSSHLPLVPVADY